MAKPRVDRALLRAFKGIAPRRPLVRGRALLPGRVQRKVIDPRNPHQHSRRAGGRRKRGGGPYL